MFKRELFAFVAGPLVLAAIVWAPAWVFVVVLDIIILGAGFELLRMASDAGIRCGRALPLLFLASLLVGAFVFGPRGLAYAAGAAVILLPAFHLTRKDAPDGALAGISVAVLAVVYLGLTGACLGWLRTMPAEQSTGIKVLVLFLVSIWIGDSGAYYVGKNLGRHKMAPQISPKKTWEGLAGGVVATFLGAACLQLLFPLPFGWTHVVALAAILAVAAPVGDLVESLFKRDTQTKDSSNLIPGHGGLLDRTDSLVFAAPFVLTYMAVMDLLGVKRIAVLGSTGSIGRSTLSVVEAFPERFEIVALAAGRNLKLLRSQITRHRPTVVAVAETEAALTLARDFPGSRFVAGPAGLEEVACATGVDTVVAALVGSMGLASTIAAIRHGRDIALANKETLVVAGDLVMSEAAQAGVNILPVDSEHNAIHQALRVGPPEGVRRLVLTASGGPFRTWSAERAAAATIAETLAHPTWNMGAKISVDSATMMNKGLEIIEAHHLFKVAEDRIDVLVHPQSLVHSLVEYVDGTYIAQLSVNDMRFPILYALAWPDRLQTPLPALDLVEAGQLTFEAPDPERFPALRLAREALRSGGEMPAVLNAANEVAVEAFLDERCSFATITRVVERVMTAWVERNRPLTTLEQAFAADRDARRLATSEVAA